MAKIAYVRVSTQEQNTGRQFECFKTKGIILDKTFEEHISGKDTNRPQLKAMLAYVREGDTVYIESISRLARNTKDFLNIFEELQNHDVVLISLKENFDTSSPQGKCMITIFASFAELERSMIKERQREGIDLALKEGRTYGRPSAVITESFKATYKDWKADRISAVEAMKREGIPKSTFYKLVQRYEMKTTTI
ncbi:MAG: recombinase family protein [Acidaminococcaceae bacterium]